VQRYTPAATKFLDDKSDKSDGAEEDLSGDEGVESRSEDEDSEGSLKDFIASSDEDESEGESVVDSNAEEKELSSRETDDESDFSVYSDED